MHIKFIILLLIILLLLFNSNLIKFSNTGIINFTSFYSEWPPNDEALNLSDCVPEIEKNGSGHFNKITFYTPKILRDTGYDKYVKDKEDKIKEEKKI